MSLNFFRIKLDLYYKEENGSNSSMSSKQNQESLMFFPTLLPCKSVSCRLPHLKSQLS